MKSTFIFRLRYLGSLVVLLASFSATMALAQTRFQLPEIPPDYAKYQTVEECLAASGRLSTTAQLQSTLIRDTTEFTRSERLDSLSPDAIAFARQCSAQFHPDTDSLGVYADWMRLYLSANRDDAAKTIVTRKLALARWSPNDTFGGRETVLKEMLDVYLNAKPIRWNDVLSISEKFDEPGANRTPFQRIATYGSIFEVAEDIGDSVTQFVMANKIITLANTLTTEQKATQSYTGSAQFSVWRALDFVSRLEIMDSLRKSTGAYVALRRANWLKAAGSANERMPARIGEHAQPLVADFWFADSVTQMTSTLSPRPTPGKVALVLFLRGCREEIHWFGGEPGSRSSYRQPCWDTYATVRRLARRYPSLEVTIVSQTTGYVGDVGPLVPTKEAAMLQSMWLGYNRLPGLLGVVNTEFFRLEGLDHRRIDQPVLNNENYSFGDHQEVPSMAAYLIDRDGTVLLAVGQNRTNERTFRELLDAVMRRAQ